MMRKVKTKAAVKRRTPMSYSDDAHAPDGVASFFVNSQPKSKWLGRKITRGIATTNSGKYQSESIHCCGCLELKPWSWLMLIGWVCHAGRVAGACIAT